MLDYHSLLIIEFENRQLIRAFQLRDVRFVARLQKVGMPLDIEEQLTHPRSPLRSVLIDTVFSPRSGPTTFILDQKNDQGKLQGLAQVRARPGRPERVVVFMAPRLDSTPGGHAIWQRLLTHLCVQTAQHGGLRVHARLPVDGEEMQIFKNVGFQSYAQENIYQFDKKTRRKQIRSDLRLRPQHPSDGWGLQKLYASLTPRNVQNAEGLAQGQWELSRQRWLEPGRRYGYVWEASGEILGALHLRAGKKGYWIRTLLHPDALDQTEALCRAALTLTADNVSVPVYFTHREYEPGWKQILPTLNFTPLTSQVLMAKSMTVRVRENRPALMKALEASHTEGATPTMMTHNQLNFQISSQSDSSTVKGSSSI